MAQGLVCRRAALRQVTRWRPHRPPAGGAERQPAVSEADGGRPGEGLRRRP